jgi:cytochrome c peroxidase
MTTQILLSIIAASFLLEAQAFEPLPKNPPIPKDNPITKEKVELGKMLYFEPRLSKSGTVSCNSCHNVMANGDDGRAVSVGIDGKKGGRSAPTVWNSAFLSVQFWDGRAKSLEEQAKGPIENPIEMGASHALVVNRLKEIDEYQKRFSKAFGGQDPINIDNVAKAIATYERTLVTSNAPFDRYLRGDKKALTKEQIEGMQKFQTTGCVACHSGPNFAGPLLPEGSGFFMKFPTYPGSKYDKQYKFLDDKGRFDVTKSDPDKHMWRVPSLRNIANTAPYFHNGSVKTLDEAVRVMAKTQLNQDLADEDVKLIVAFLTSLTGEFPKQVMPRLPATVGRSHFSNE